MVSEKDLLKMSPEQVGSLKLSDLQQTLSPAAVEFIFKACNAFWHHPGESDPTAPHARLTTGKHSDIYVNCPLVLCRSNLCQIMALQLLLRLSDAMGNDVSKISWVTGSDSSALGLSKDVANILGAKWHPMQKAKDVDGKEIQVWKGMVIGRDELVLHIEELAVTATTSERVRAGIRRAHEYPINFAPFLPILVFRPSGEDVPRTIDGSQVISVLDYQTFVVDPREEVCPLCAQGSEALKPKGENWERLVSSM